MAAATNVPPKRASAVLPYVFDWTAWLAGAAIQGTPQITADTGLSVNPSPHGTSVNGGQVTVWLGGGTPGAFYNVTCPVQTSDGRVDSRSFLLEVING